MGKMKVEWNQHEQISTRPTCSMKWISWKLIRIKLTGLKHNQSQELWVKIQEQWKLISNRIQLMKGINWYRLNLSVQEGNYRESDQESMTKARVHASEHRNRMIDIIQNNSK